MRWMNLESIIQSEVSQKEKHKYCMLMRTYGISKDHNDGPICRVAYRTHIKNRLLDYVEKARVG